MSIASLTPLSLFMILFGMILEIGYEEIQQSPSYSSGFALRFPRVIRLRDDKGVDEISTMKDVKNLFDFSCVNIQLWQYNFVGGSGKIFA